LTVGQSRPDAASIRRCGLANLEQFNALESAVLHH
jgi:hypothetical protein